MLKNTFCHIKGISPAGELKLWDAGFLSWEDVLSGRKTPLSPNKQRTLEGAITESAKALSGKNLQFFADSLPRSERWRLIPHLGKTAFIDIETTGLQDYDHVTTIALADHTRVKTYVYGRNLSTEFHDDIKQYDSIVTFNGSCFDLPVLRRKLRLSFPHTHIDLRFVFSALGIKGGLKRIEKQYDLDRDELDGVDGYTAVLLWEKFKTEKNNLALESLLAYNVEDVLSLQQLLPIAFNEHRSKVYIKEIVPQQNIPALLQNPHTADTTVLMDILGLQRAV